MSDRAAVRDIPPPRATLAEFSTAVAIMLGLFAGALPLGACGRARGPHAAAAPDSGGQQAAGPGPAPVAEAAPPPRGKELIIAYSSNLLGEYEPCG